MSSICQTKWEKLFNTRKQYHNQRRMKNYRKHHNIIKYNHYGIKYWSQVFYVIMMFLVSFICTNDNNDKFMYRTVLYDQVSCKREFMFSCFSDSNFGILLKCSAILLCSKNTSNIKTFSRPYKLCVNSSHNVFVMIFMITFLLIFYYDLSFFSMLFVVILNL